MHCRHCKRNAERRGWSTQCCLGANNNSTKFPNFQSTLAFVREFRRSEEVVPSLWVVLVIQAVSELPVAQFHGMTCEMNSCFWETIQWKYTYPFSFTVYFIGVIVSQFNHFFLTRFRESALFIGRGGWAGASEGRVISKFFTNWGGSNLFYSQPGEGHNFFWQGKNYSISPSWFLFVSKHAKCIET